MAFTHIEDQRRFNSGCERLDELVAGAGIVELQTRVAAMEEKSSANDFWDDQAEARETLKQLERLRNRFNSYRDLQKAVEEIDLLLEMAEEDPQAEDEAKEQLNRFESALEILEFKRMFSGPHDNASAILEINSGAGGTEAQDWADMLKRMYLRWAERNGFEAELLSELAGEEAGIKNVALRISGEQAYGWLKSENGVHRLVRISPFDSNARRHTSFASVFAMPEFEDDTEIEILDKDLRVDTYRSSGAGGQHVNKTDSAIRLTHIPTGIVVSCQMDRSQHKNRATALNMLRSRLFELQERERRQQLDKINSVKQEIAWGSQIRSYVLQPYRLVKDHRTGVEIGNTDGVLDGEINPFIEAFLRAGLAKDAVEE